MTEDAVKSRHRLGLPPGTLIHVGDREPAEVRVTIFDYTELEFNKEITDNVEECNKYCDRETTTWINVDGINHVDVVEKLGRHFNIDYLVLEDVLHTDQRPKLEDHGDYIYITLKMVTLSPDNDGIKFEHVSFIVGKGYLLSFQECSGDTFTPVRNRLERSSGRIRKAGSDYLAYALIDTIVDNYFMVTEFIEGKIEELEDIVLGNAGRLTMQEIHLFKRELIFLRKVVWPMLELISQFAKGDSPLIQPATLKYVRDVHDHAIYILESLDSLRDTVSSLLDAYLSMTSQRMNEVMKVLTVIATIFIPLTFLAGVYGMNFDYMPELAWPWAYPSLMAGMLIAGVAMFIYFKFKKWI